VNAGLIDDDTADQFGISHGLALLLLDHDIFFIDQNLAILLVGDRHHGIGNDTVKLALDQFDGLPGDSGVGNLE
jgi:hypothetical protein